MYNITTNDRFHAINLNSIGIYRLTAPNSFILEVTPLNNLTLDIVKTETNTTLYSIQYNETDGTTQVQIDLPIGVYHFIGGEIFGLVRELQYSPDPLYIPQELSYGHTQVGYLQRWAECPPEWVHPYNELTVTCFNTKMDVVLCINGICSDGTSNATYPPGDLPDEITRVGDCFTVPDIACLDNKGYPAVLDNRILEYRTNDGILLRIHPNYPKYIGEKMNYLLEQYDSNPELYSDLDNEQITNAQNLYEMAYGLGETPDYGTFGKIDFTWNVIGGYDAILDYGGMVVPFSPELVEGLDFEYDENGNRIWEGGIIIEKGDAETSPILFIN